MRRLVWLVAVLCAAGQRPAAAFLGARLISGQPSQSALRLGAGLCPTRAVYRARTHARASLRLAGSEERSEALLDVLGEEPEESDGVSAAAPPDTDDDDEAGASAGSFRQRRAAKKKAAARTGQVSNELRFKLLEEQASPFRRFRQFFYLAAAGSASIGTFIAGTRVIAGLQVSKLSYCSNKPRTQRSTLIVALARALLSACRCKINLL